MIRTFNYTGRQRIDRGRLAVDLRDAADGVKSFDALVRLDGLGFPPQARVYVEAYYRYVSMRFAFGSVAQLEAPPDRRLTLLRGTDVIRFRLKVVDESGARGRLLGIASGVATGNGSDPAPSRRTLLYVNPTDLGEEIWRVQFDDEMPVLEVNNRIEGIRELARGDRRFFSLVYPSVVRTVLSRILLVERYDDPEADRDDWRSLWLDFVCRTTGVAHPPVVTDGNGSEQYEDWIVQAVAAFCRKHEACGRFLEELASEEEE